MSALSNMAGMYPVNGMDMLENITFWQPIPIHSQPREMDPMLWMDCPCPEETKIYWNEVMASNEVKEIEAQNKDFLEFLFNKTGLPQMTLDDVWDIWDPLNCERIYNSSHQWPDWMNETIFEKLTELMHLSTTFYYHNPKIQRLRGSLLFKDIATRLQQKATNSNLMKPELKYFVYSAHDTTITALLDNLGQYHGHLPEYASAVLFELHEKEKGKFTVETWYVNVTYPTGLPVPLTVKGCEGEECSLEDFVKSASANAPESIDAWHDECFYNDMNISTTMNVSSVSTTTPVAQPNCDNAKQPATIAAIVLGITTGVFLFAFLVTLFLFCRLKKRNKIAHRPY